MVFLGCSCFFSSKIDECVSLAWRTLFFGWFAWYLSFILWPRPDSQCPILMSTAASFAPVLQMPQIPALVPQIFASRAPRRASYLLERCQLRFLRRSTVFYNRYQCYLLPPSNRPIARLLVSWVPLISYIHPCSSAYLYWHRLRSKALTTSETFLLDTIHPFWTFPDFMTFSASSHQCI